MRLTYEPAASRRVTQAREFGHVAVLSAATRASARFRCCRGNAVLGGLRRRGVDAHAFDPRERRCATAGSAGFERVWIALHGPGGEDGTLQGALEWLGRALHRQRRDGFGDRHGQAAHQARGARPSASAPRTTWCCAAQRTSKRRCSA